MRWIVWIGLVVAIAGCGDKKIDSAKLEGDIKDDAAKEGLVLDAVDCPSPKIEEGDTFECTVTVKGEERKLEVVQRSHESAGYDLGPLLTFTAGNDAGGDRASVSYVIQAVNRDVTALCDYATKDYRRSLTEGGTSCAKAAAAKYGEPLRDYSVVAKGDTATVSRGPRTVKLERQPDGSWLITDVAG